MNPVGQIAAKISAVALAIGLDVLALSIGVGVAGPEWKLRIRLGFAFASAEIAMQLVGYAIGTGAGRVIGEVADLLGLGVLALVGIFMLAQSYRGTGEERSFDPTKGGGLVLSSLSISLDSLGVGFALPAVGIPLMPLLITISITTLTFTFAGLAFGQRLGDRYERGAERLAGATLIVLALVFSAQHLLAGG